MPDLSGVLPQALSKGRSDLLGMRVSSVVLSLPESLGLYVVQPMKNKPVCRLSLDTFGTGSA